MDRLTYENGNDLLALSRAIIRGEEPPRVSLTQELVRFCAAQQMIGFLYRGIRPYEGAYDESLAAAVRQRYMASVAQQVQQDHYRTEIFAALAAAEIPYLPLKGALLREFYSHPDLRFSCDVDFLYSKEHRNRVNEILLRMGFKHIRRESTNDSFMLGAVHIEPHFILNDASDRFEAYYADIWSRLQSEDGIRFHFSDEDFYVFYLLHTYKHFILGGAGIRSVADAWLFRSSHPSMDEVYLADTFERLDIASFVRQYERLGRVWFGEERGDEDTSALFSYLFVGGAYGALEQGAVMHMLRTGNRRSSRLRYFLRQIFPPYELLRKRYPILKKAPILFPFCQIARWLRVIFSKDRKNIRRNFLVGAEIGRTDEERLQCVWDLIKGEEESVKG